MLEKISFAYDEHHDCYLCPEAQVLEYNTTNRDGYREYKPNPQRCRACPRLKEYTQSRDCTQVITRHVREESKEQIIKHRYEERSKRIYKKVNSGLIINRKTCISLLIKTANPAKNEPRRKRRGSSTL